MEITVGNAKIVIKKGDITLEDVDAIVNAANSRLLGGGGVDGAIHRAGGPKILEECKALVSKRGGGCPAGEAVITTAGNLPAKYVIHTVGPVWRGGKAGEEGLLRQAYQSSLQLALDYNLKTVAFPSISTGAYGFPIENAAPIALNTVKEFLNSHPHFHEVRFLLFSDRDFQIYKNTLEKL